MTRAQRSGVDARPAMNHGARAELLRRTLAVYADSPRAERLFVRARACLSDLTVVERHAPRSGTILDIGCGHGLLTNLLALGSPARDVLGIDIDAAKIEAARRSLRGRANVRFAVAPAARAPGGPYEAITIGDVCYLLPPAEQRALIAQCHRLLAPGGTLLWKSQVRRPRWKFAITYAQEWLMTHVGPTAGSGLYFLDTAASLDALRAAGFRAAVRPMPSWRPYTDVLFIGRKPG